jgi:hypothetical protein
MQDATILLPVRIEAKSFTDANAAATRLEEIYERNTAFLRAHFEAFASGKPLTNRVRATYPHVRITQRRMRAWIHAYPMVCIWTWQVPDHGYATRSLPYIFN